MNEFVRFAVYYSPEPGPLSRFGAEWLGWDPASGRPCPQPQIDGLPRPLAELTEAPRRYGFHATVKPPFRLAETLSLEALSLDLAALARRLAPVWLDALRLGTLGDFLALVPAGDASVLGELAQAVVEGLDHFRAPPAQAELARRRAAGLTARQESLLARWGYPYVAEEFRFHLTLTGPLRPGEPAGVERALAPLVAPLLPQPFVIADLCLFGEDAEGRFHLLHRYPLGA
jgi:putative phosphonate metabolism protein